jgi:hypothetical protein
MKNADWKPNKHIPVTYTSAQEFAKLPTYYVTS